MSQYRVAILVVSDTASANVHADKSGPTIKEILTGRGYEVKYLLVVPDNDWQIQAALKSWCEKGDVDWIITTGGTGFGVRDRTPEAISPLLERNASGLVHLLLSTSLKHTPLAALSRPVAGTIRNTLIVTLPGSVKAVKENLEALLSGGVADHALDLIKGGTGNRVHATLASSADLQITAGSDQGHGASGHHHHHHHHHDHSHDAPKSRTVLSHDPSLAASARLRVSPYPLLSLEEAIDIILKETTPLETIKRLVMHTLKGHVLAEDVYAPQNVPLTQTTNVDGYALRSTDRPGVFKVLTSQTHSLSNVLPQGCVFRINTGGPLPAGTDAVIMVEDTRLLTTLKDNDGEDIEEKEIETLAQVSVAENVRAAGSDVVEGDRVMHNGEIIRSVGGEIGTLAFVGRKEVEVYRKPIVALLSTGNELIDLQSPNQLSGDGWGGIWDTNRPSLQAALEGMGYEVVDVGVVPDELNTFPNIKNSVLTCFRRTNSVTSHVTAIKCSLERADLLLTTGGTSMGATDLLKPVIERHFNGTIHFGRVAAKPGKPTTFATIPFSWEGCETTKYMFALPGNPASALVTFYIFVLPALRKLGGWPQEQCQLPRVKVTIQNAMKLDPRTEFHRVVIRAEKNGLKAYSTGGQRSSRVASLSGANGLVILPKRKEDGPKMINAGEHLEAVLIGEIQMV